MKIVLFIFLSIFILSCDSNKFKVGECVQKPDSITVWKVIETKDGNLTLNQKVNPNEKETMSAKGSGGWIKTQCP